MFAIKERKVHRLPSSRGNKGALAQATKCEWDEPHPVSEGVDRFATMETSAAYEDIGEHLPPFSFLHFPPLRRGIFYCNPNITMYDYNISTFHASFPPFAEETPVAPPGFLFFNKTVTSGVSNMIQCVPNMIHNGSNMIQCNTEFPRPLSEMQ